MITIIKVMLVLLCAVNVAFCSSWISSSTISGEKRFIRSSLDNSDDNSKRSKRSVPSDNMAKMVVDTHNEYRASVGANINEPEPSDMRYMTWDDTLAANSLWYAKKCVFKHSTDEQRLTKHFNIFNGENLWAGQGDYKTNFDPRVGISSWFDEYVDFEFDTQYCTPGKLCGHYTQMVWADTYKLGCAWTICDVFDTNQGSVWYDAAYMVCHYAPGGNMVGEPLYKIGPSCSQCQENDTCPDGKLCRNVERDKLLSGPVDTGEIIAVTLVCLILAASLSVGGYYFYKHRKNLLLTWRNRRKISNHALNGSTDSGTTATNGEVKVETAN